MAQTALAFDKHINDWTNSSKANKALYKGGNIYRTVAIILQVCLLILPIILIAVTIGGSIKDVSDVLDKTKKTLEISKTLIIVSSAVGIAAALWYIIDIISTLVFGGWMRKNNVNALPELKQFVDIKISRSGKARFRKVATAASVDKNKSVVVLNAVASIFRMAASIVIAIAVISYIGNTIIDNIINMLDVAGGGALKIDFKAIIEGWKPFVIMVAASIILSILSSIIRMIWKSHCFGWIRSEATKDYNAQVAAEQESASTENK